MHGIALILVLVLTGCVSTTMPAAEDVAETPAADALGGEYRTQVTYYASVCAPQCVKSQDSPHETSFDVVGDAGSHVAVSLHVSWTPTSPFNERFYFYLHPVGDGFDDERGAEGESPISADIQLEAGRAYRVGYHAVEPVQGGPPQSFEVIVRGPLIARAE